VRFIIYYLFHPNKTDQMNVKAFFVPSPQFDYISYPQNTAEQ